MSVTDRRELRMRAALADRLGSMVVVLEAVRRRHNVSAILRSCEAFGIHEVHVSCAGFEPSRGASRGAERWLDMRVHATTEACIEDLHARGFRVLVAEPGPGAMDVEDVDVLSPFAVLLGSELVGVSEVARARSDGAVRIAMRGLTESLNVSVAGGCLIYRLAERRRAVVGGPDLSTERQAAAAKAWVSREDQGRNAMRLAVQNLLD